MEKKVQYILGKFWSIGEMHILGLFNIIGEVSGHWKWEVKLQ